MRTMLVIPTLFGVDIGRWDGGGGGQSGKEKGTSLSVCMNIDNGI